MDDRKNWNDKMHMYAPVCEKGVKSKVKMEKFWEDLGQLLKKFENIRRIFLLGDINARVGGREIGGVVGGYGLKGVDENGQHLNDSHMMTVKKKNNNNNNNNNNNSSSSAPTL